MKIEIASQQLVTAMTITKIMIITARTTSATHPPAAMASAISSTVAATAFAGAAMILFSPRCVLL